MIPSGVYRIYELQHGESDTETPYRRFIGRLWVEGDKMTHLEDHHGKMEDLFPEGQPSSMVERRFKMLQHSGYYQIVNEADMAAGHHPQELQPLDLGEMECDQKFVMTGDSLAIPQMVEIWHDAVMIDGRRLDEEEARQVLGEVSAGRLVLTPVG